MDYKKKYKEALEKARQLCAYSTTKPFISDLQDIFPELTEPEDERIRKAIIEHFAGSHSSMYPYKGFTKEQILAWLEKQGKAKGNKDSLDNQDKDERLKETTIAFLKEYADKGYENAVECIDWLKKQGEQKSNWSEEDEKKRTLLIRILAVNYPNGYFKVNPANTLHMEAISTEELISWLKSLKLKL